MWTLILSACSTDQRGGVTITYVPGFTSQEKCEAAGKEFLAKTRQDDFNFSYSCAEQ